MRATYAAVRNRIDAAIGTAKLGGLTSTTFILPEEITEETAGLVRKAMIRAGYRVKVGTTVGAYTSGLLKLPVPTITLFW